MSTVIPLANRSLKRTIKQAIHQSRVYAPFLPLIRAVHKVACLLEALAWCRAQSRLLSDDDRRAAGLEDRCQLYEFLMKRYGLNAGIDYLEFGVYMGASIKWWVKHNISLESRFFGFDTFTGLPEDWGSVRKGYFSTNGNPPVEDDGRVHFIKGLFQDTLGDFLSRYRPGKRRVVHVDADLYSSTLFVLTRLAPVLKQNDIIIFDEFVSWRNTSDEFRAFRDFTSSYQIECRLIGAADLFSHVAVQIV